MVNQVASKTPVVSIVGASNSGKTTFIVKLISELKSRGYKVASIKHTSHGFDIDRPGKDSYRHAEAGAEAVIIVSKDKLAMVKNVEPEMPFEDIIGLFGDGYDIILTEGYKSYPLPKIEILREGYSKGLISPIDELLGIVTDIEADSLLEVISKIESAANAAGDLKTDHHSILKLAGKPAVGEVKPQFKSNDVTGVADLIEKDLLKA
jgi:molybdopterin-guanine dinucleotide biosynthesis protein MobB